MDHDSKKTIDRICFLVFDSRGLDIFRNVLMQLPTDKVEILYYARTCETIATSFCTNTGITGGSIEEALKNNVKYRVVVSTGNYTIALSQVPRFQAMMLYARHAGKRLLEAKRPKKHFSNFLLRHVRPERRLGSEHIFSRGVLT